MRYLYKNESSIDGPSFGRGFEDLEHSDVTLATAVIYFLRKGNQTFTK
jgi:hypothetical protein